MINSPIVVIAGPTASGKTSLAIEIASRLNGEIISADSVQVYRGFNIGSAKPTLEDQKGISHHLIDILDPNEFIDAMNFAQRSSQTIKEITERGRLPIIVGGTGLWIRALLRGLVSVPAVDAEIRSRLEQSLLRDGSHAWHHHLAQVDPKAASQIHPNDSLRIVRALEVYEQTGIPMGELRASHARGTLHYKGFFVTLNPSLSFLEERIEQRVQSMLENGWVKEIQSLYDQWGGEVRAFGSVGYRQMLAYIRAEDSLESALLNVRKATRLYARKQRNWFRHEKDFVICEHADELLEGSLWQQLCRATQ